MDFDVKELDRQARRVVHESGWLPGVKAGLSTVLGRAQLRLDTSCYGGDVDYDGWTRANVSINSSTDQSIWDAGLTAVYQLPLVVSLRFKPCAGIGYRHRGRRIQPVGSI